MAADIVTILVVVPGGTTDKFKCAREAIKSAADVRELIRTRHTFKDESLEYYDNDCDMYISFHKDTFDDAHFHSDKCVKMNIIASAEPAANVATEPAASVAAPPIPQNTDNNTSDGASTVSVAKPVKRRKQLAAKLREAAFPTQKEYTLPAFPPIVADTLIQNNAKFQASKLEYKPEKKILSRILETIVGNIFIYTRYPTTNNIIVVCNALIKKYPCLGFKGEIGSWKYRISSKANVMRGELRKAGNLEVNVSKRKSPNDAANRRKMPKLGSRGEVNPQPELQEGETFETLEETVNLLIEEYSKAEPDMVFVKEKMSVTFPSRRYYINKEGPRMEDVQEKYPFLFNHEQVQIVSATLQGSFPYMFSGFL